MPAYDNAPKLVERIRLCNNELDELFSGIQLSKEFEQQLKEIKAFYARSFNRTKDEIDGEYITQEYRSLINTAKKVKRGELKSDRALDAVKKLSDSREYDIIIHNILKVCELLFWGTVAAASILAFATFGAPLLICEPLLGLAVSFTSSFLFFTTADKFLNCFDQFKSFDRIDAESKREIGLISFFSPKPSVNLKAVDQERNEIDAPVIFNLNSAVESR